MSLEKIHNAMDSLSENQLPSSGQGHLRPVQPQRDLPAIADLVEICFKDNLDPDGYSYLRQLRKAAKNNQVLHWAATAAEAVGGLPMMGYVWEEQAHIVGNLSLIPLRDQGKRIYLIANVAVHPDYRQRGVARVLTDTAVTSLRQRGVQSVWLQVRDNNQPAVHLYQSLGFEERARRTTWTSAEQVPVCSLPVGAYLDKRLDRHWEQQSKWLQRLYPQELNWHLPLRLSLIQPGLLGTIRRFLSFEYPTHWTIQRGRQLLAALTSYYEGGYAASLWLAAPPEAEMDGDSVSALLAAACRRNRTGRPFSLNLPWGYGVDSVTAAGFQNKQTLIWMYFDLTA